MKRPKLIALLSIIWLGLTLAAGPGVVAPAGPPAIVFSSPTFLLPRKTLLQFIDNSTTAPPGRLIYIGGYFVLVRSGVAGKRKGGILNYDYTLRDPSIAFEPQFSPDGRYILFRVGWPYDPPYAFKLFLLDLQTHKLQHGPPESITNRVSFWSPNSTSFAYFGAGSRGEDVLQVFNLRTGKSRRIIQAPGVTEMSWAPQDTILFTLRGTGLPRSRPPVGAAPPTPPTPIKEPLPDRPLNPSIYQAVASGGRPELVLEGAASPTVSPDGKWIAYFGSPTEPPVLSAQADEVEHHQYEKRLRRVEQEATLRPQLCLYDRTTKARFAVTPETFSAAVRWSPDSRYLVLLTSSYNGKTGQAVIKVVDVVAKTARQIATFQEEDDRPLHRPANAAQFQPLQVSKDGRYLIVSTTKLLPSDGGSTSPMAGYLRFIDLSSGKTSNVAETKADKGMDWQDESIAMRAPKASYAPR